MNAAWIVAAGVGGALLGPRLRGPIFHHSVAAGQPRQQSCPHCGRRLRAPGWRGLTTALPASGRCPGCARRIGPPPGTVEVTAAAVLALLTWRVSQPLPLLALAWTFTLGVALVFIDIAVHRLPDRLTLPAVAGALAVLGVAAAVDGQGGRMAAAVAYAAGVTACYLVLILINPAGMGLGDSKTGLSTGLVTGWYGGTAAVAGAAAGFLLAGVCALALLLSGRVGPGDALPHGPFMLLGALASVVLFAG